MTQAQTTTAVTLAAALAFASLFGFAGSAAAYFGGNDDGDRTTVRNSNVANVTNTVEVEAETGENDADGEDGGNGGRGGDATNRGGDRGTDRTNGGDGGRGGNGGNGGSITTGAATAFGTVNNNVNSNTTHIEGCGCDDDRRGMFNWWFGGESGDNTRVTNRNEATVMNDLEVEAETGENDVDGGDAGNGGRGGDARDTDNDRQVRGYKMWFGFMGWGQQNGSDTTNGGNGAAGGNGGNGGTVRTGAALADGLVDNVVNRNTTRILRGGAEAPVN